MSGNQVTPLRSVGDLVGPENLPDPGSRLEKARKIGRALEEFLGSDTKGLRCLDVGSSIGIISAHLSEQFGRVFGVEPSVAAVRAAVNAWSRPNVFFILGDGLHLPLADESLDIAVCAQVYEHVPHAGTLMAEIWREGRTKHKVRV